MRLNVDRAEQRINLYNYKDTHLKLMSPGETIHIHHCKDGHNNNRFYITYLSDGSGYVGYCHHCNRSGFYFNSKAHRMYGRALSNGVTGEHALIKSLHIDDVTLVNELSNALPKSPKEFLRKRGVTLNELVEYDARINHEVVLIPVGSVTDARGAGYQTRFIEPKKGLPKVLSNQLHPNAFIFEPKIALLENNLVIVEDFFSAIVVCRELLVPTLWLGSTSLHPKQIQAIREFAPQKIVVWLDNDNYNVELSAINLTKDLNDLNYKAERVKLKNVDPKYLYTKDYNTFSDTSNFIHEYFTST